MAYLTLPTPERTKTGFEAFSEGASPYLQQAFAMMLQRKMQEQQLQREQQEWENLQQPSRLPIIPEYQQSAQQQGIQTNFDINKLRYGTPEQNYQKMFKALGAEQPSIPTKFQAFVEKVKGTPGLKMKVPGTTGMEYTVPDTFKIEKEKRTAERQDLARANLLRKEFIDRPEIKEFVTVRNKVNSMDALLTNINDKQSRLALDQGLITLFNKITDPNSVVRESEYERTPHNLSLANRFSGAIEKLQKGGAGLTNEDRESLVWGAKIIANEQGKMFNERLSQYSDIAQAYGVEPSLVTAGVEGFTPYESNKQPQEQGGLSLEELLAEKQRRMGR